VTELAIAPSASAPPTTLRDSAADQVAVSVIPSSRIERSQRLDRHVHRVIDEGEPVIVKRLGAGRSSRTWRLGRRENGPFNRVKRSLASNSACGLLF